jgi:hypothetical protein
METETQTKPLPPLQNSRFASCRNSRRMLITLPEVSGRNFIFVPMNKPNLIRGEIFRGNFSPRENQPKTTDPR